METLINQKIKAQPVLKNVLKKKFFFKKKKFLGILLLLQYTK